MAGVPCPCPYQQDFVAYLDSVGAVAAFLQPSAAVAVVRFELVKLSAQRPLAAAADAFVARLAEALQVCAIVDAKPLSEVVALLVLLFFLLAPVAQLCAGPSGDQSVAVFAAARVGASVAERLCSQELRRQQILVSAGALLPRVAHLERSTFGSWLFPEQAQLAVLAPSSFQRARVAALARRWSLPACRKVSLQSQVADQSCLGPRQNAVLHF